MQIVVKTSEIVRALSLLKSSLKEAFGTSRPYVWSFPGGGGQAEIPTWEDSGDHERLAVGFSSEEDWGTRVPVLIALEKAGNGISPVVEINIPLKDRRKAINRNRKVNGCFARDEAGRLWLCHRGVSLTTTPTRIPKETIHTYFQKWLVPADDGSQMSNIIPVAPLDSAEELSFGLVRFASAIRELKSTWAIAAGDEQKVFHLCGWRSEITFPERISRVFTEVQASYEYRHGPVQQALQHYLRERLVTKCQAVLNDRIDLGIVRDDRLVAIFEVKTGLGSQLYSGIGQLLVYRQQLAQDKTVPLFLVLPAGAATFEELGEADQILRGIGVTLVFQKGKNFVLSDERELCDALNPQWIQGNAAA